MSVTSSDNVSSRVRVLSERWLGSIAARLTMARWPVAVVGLMILGVTTWWVTNSAIFDLQTLYIRGNVQLTKAQVARLGDLTSEVNVLWTLPGSIERRLQGHPLIREANVSRTLPSGLTVVIRERRPVAVLPGTGAVLAPDGKVVGKKARSDGLPVISTAVSTDGGGRGLSADGLAVARSIPGKLRRLIEDITVDQAGLIELRLRDGTVVMYGDRSDIKVKSAVLGAILQWTARTGTTAKTIDVSAPGAPRLVPGTMPESSA